MSETQRTYDPDRPVQILHVEDEVDDHILAANALASAGIKANLIQVSTGEDALHYLHGEGEYAKWTYRPTPDVILLDLHMPKLNGFDVLESVKSDPRFKDIPVVVFTNSLSPDEHSRANAAGASAYIAKTQLFDRIVYLLDMVSCCWEKRPAGSPQTLVG